MIESEVEGRIRTHQAVIAELNVLSPAVEAFQMKISQFILENLGLIGLSYPSVEILMNEKDVKIQQKAITVISEELRTRSNPDSPNYRLIYRKIPDSRVRKVLSKCRGPSEKDKHANGVIAPIDMICPHCQKEIQCVPEKRGKVLSFRGTDIEDDAITMLSSRCNVSRSFLINELLKIERKFGYSLKKK